MMGLTQDVGSAGESYAAKFIAFKGFEILHKNWRSGQLEIDLVAKDGNKLIFIEVKSSVVVHKNIHPEDKVNPAKQRKLIRAAQKYLMKNPHPGPLRFDVVSVLMTPFSRQLYYHPDAFFPLGN